MDLKVTSEVEIETTAIHKQIRSEIQIPNLKALLYILQFLSLVFLFLINQLRYCNCKNKLAKTMELSSLPVIQNLGTVHLLLVEVNIDRNE